MSASGQAYNISAGVNGLGKAQSFSHLPTEAEGLVFCSINKFAQALELGEDRIRCRGPDKRLCSEIVVLGVALDATNEVRDAFEGTAPDSLLRDQPKPPFDLVEPRGIGRRVVHVIAWPPRQPSTYLRMLVGRVVIADQVQYFVLRGFPIDLAQELQPFSMPMALLALFNHGSIQRSIRFRRGVARKPGMGDVNHSFSCSGFPGNRYRQADELVGGCTRRAAGYIS